MSTCFVIVLLTFAIMFKYFFRDCMIMLCNSCAGKYICDRDFCGLDVCKK